MRLRAGLQVFWRGKDESQVGTDPRCGIVLEGLQPGEQRLLELLPHDPTMADLERAARTQGVGLSSARELVELLERAGVLHPDRAVRPAWRPPTVPPDEAYWSRLRADGDGSGVMAHRAAATVAVLGLDRLGMGVAVQLAMAGVGTVLVEDTRVVTEADLGLLHARSLGGSRGEQVRRLLRTSFPRLRTTAPPHTHPDVLVAVSAYVADPVRLRPLMREDVTHLPIVVGDVDVSVGPLVVPGQGPCARCLDLHRTDADPSWPAVATQLRLARQTGTDSGVAQLAASLATHQVLAHLDGREVAVRAASLEVGALNPCAALRRWSVHPECGCQGPPTDIWPAHDHPEPVVPRATGVVGG